MRADIGTIVLVLTILTVGTVIIHANRMETKAYHCEEIAEKGWVGK